MGLDLGDPQGAVHIAYWVARNPGLAERVLAAFKELYPELRKLADVDAKTMISWSDSIYRNQYDPPLEDSIRAMGRRLQHALLGSGPGPGRQLVYYDDIVTVDVPLFTFGAPAVAGCKVEIKTESTTKASATWKVSLPIGESRRTQTRTVSYSGTFTADAHEYKELFVPMIGTLRYIMDATESAPKRHIRFASLDRITGQHPTVRSIAPPSIDPRPYAFGDDSERYSLDQDLGTQPAIFQTVYRTADSRTVDLSGSLKSVSDVKVGANVAVAVESALTITCTLMPGYNYQLVKKVGERHGIWWIVLFHPLYPGSM
jgi:hypothetical protein